MSGQTVKTRVVPFAPGDTGWLGRKDRVAITILDRRAGLAVRASCEPRLAAGFGIVQMLDAGARDVGYRMLDDG